MSAEDEEKHAKATHCWICRGPFQNYVRPEWVDVITDSEKVLIMTTSRTETTTEEPLILGVICNYQMIGY